MTSIAENLKLMDSHKLAWHMDRVRAWERGERIAPLLIDMALTRKCDARCVFCYSVLQENERHVWTKEVVDNFLEDCARMGVKAISLLSDGESVLSPVFCHTIERAAELGISISSGSNCHMFTPEKQERVLKYLTYLRVNCPAGELKRYCEITRTNPRFYKQVIENVRNMVAIKKRDSLPITLGLQMVLRPQDADQIIPFVKLGKELGMDYAVIKHCSDDEDNSLGIDYDAYAALRPLLQEAESYATENYAVIPMWAKMMEGKCRNFQRCYGPPFLLQISGSGLVAACGHKFDPQYAEKFWIGNVCSQRWWDIWQSDRYWEVMDYLRSEQFDAQIECGPVCRLHAVSEALNAHVGGARMTDPDPSQTPIHVNFI